MLPPNDKMTTGARLVSGVSIKSDLSLAEVLYKYIER